MSLRRRVGSLVLAASLLVGWPSAKALAHADPFAPLHAVLDRAPRSLWGLEIRTLSGEVLLQRHAEGLFAPASTLKLATAYAALLRLGPAARFRTELLSAAPLTGPELGGDLAIKGFGDPTLESGDLDAFVAALQAKGVRRVAGDLVADASLFEGPRVPPGWMWDDLSLPFAAPVSALSLDGNAPSDQAAPPELRAARTLAGKLSAAGIAIAGTVRVGEAPTDASLLYCHVSPPLSEIVRTLNKASSNLYAETLVRHLGLVRGAGTHPAGMAEMTGILSEAGWASESFRVEDGSGLSRYNLVTPSQLASLLVAAARMPAFETFLASLPVAGVDGTLATRMRGTRAEGRVLAKTGTMSGVSCLAGYVVRPGREPLVVVMMVNGFVGSARSVQGLQDAVIEALIQALE